jgi:hypothetical protein
MQKQARALAFYAKEWMILPARTKRVLAAVRL